MRKTILLLCLILCPQIAVACSSAVKPRGQTPFGFYDKDKYGWLGIKDGNFIRILDQYRCYDLSYLDDKNLSIYFNNASSEDGDPTYMGALIVRTFRKGPYIEGPFSAYLFRSASIFTASGTSWAHGSAEQGQARPGTELKIVSNSYDPEDAIRAPDFAGLDRRLRLGSPDSEALLKEWHSLIVKAQAATAFVYRDTLRSDKQWSLDAKFNDGSPSYLIVRSYLIKYQMSQNAKTEVYFTSGASSADCVYIKLIAPGDELTTFSIEQNGSSFFSLKMKPDAVCSSPN